MILKHSGIHHVSGKMSYESIGYYTMIIHDDRATGEFLDCWNNDQEYIVAHTSGSTGTPKSIRLLKSDMEASARSTCRFFDINAGSILVCPLSADYIAGKMMIVRALVSGATLYMEHPSSHPLIRQYGHIDLLPIVPAQLDGLLDVAASHDIGNVIIGGAPLSMEAERSLYGAGFKAYATYGMTETCSHVALRAISSESDGIYSALPGYHFKTDARSCLEIHSSLQSFGCLVTNDVVELIDYKQFKWLGRHDNVIITGGFKVHPETLERRISPFIIPDYYIASRQDKKWGRHIVLYIEGDRFDTTDLVTRLRENLKSHELPREIIFISKFDRTLSGKIVRLQSTEF